MKTRMEFQGDKGKQGVFLMRLKLTNLRVLVASKISNLSLSLKIEKAMDFLAVHNVNATSFFISTRRGRRRGDPTTRCPC